MGSPKIRSWPCHRELESAGKNLVSKYVLTVANSESMAPAAYAVTEAGIRVSPDQLALLQ